MRVRRYAGQKSLPLLPFDPISLVLAQRNGVEPPKKSAFLPRWLHHSRERFCLSCRYSSSPDLGRRLGGYLSGCLRRGRPGFVMAALRGWSIARASLSLSASAHLQKRVFWGSTPFLWARAKKWGGIGSRGRQLLTGERRTRTGTNEGPPYQMLKRGTPFLGVPLGRSSYLCSGGRGQAAGAVPLRLLRYW